MSSPNSSENRRNYSYSKHIKISMPRILQLETAGVLHTSIKSANFCIPDYLLQSVEYFTDETFYFV